MGLDMYLIRSKRAAGVDHAKAFEVMIDSLPERFSTRKPIEPLFASLDLDALLGVQGANVLKQAASVQTITRSNGETLYWRKPWDEIGYWRKANAIHAWFVDNVQNGNDDCSFYEVTEHHLIDLRNAVVAALEAYQAGDTVECEDHLPIRGGFFFGSTDYGELYEEDLDYTLTVIDSAFDVVDFEEDILLYRSSW